jgi:hypothetical protein
MRFQIPPDSAKCRNRHTQSHSNNKATGTLSGTRATTNIRSACHENPAVSIENTLNLVNAMRAPKRPVEAHLLQEGGHAFGMSYSNTPSLYGPICSAVA